MKKAETEFKSIKNFRSDVKSYRLPENAEISEFGSKFHDFHNEKTLIQ